MSQLMAEGTPPPPAAGSPPPQVQPPPQPPVPPTQAPPTPIKASAPVNLPPRNDVDPTYLDHRDGLQGRAAVQSLMAEGGGAQPAEQNVPPGGEQPPKEEQPGPLGKAAHGVVRAIGAVGKDVGVGLTEAPRQALLEGPRNALQAMATGAQDLGDWLQKAGHIPGLKIDTTGVHVVSSEEMEKLSSEGNELFDFHSKSGTLPDFGQAKTVTGGVVSAAAQFVTSMATLGRVFGPMGTEAGGVAGHAALAGKSALATFAGFDKAQGNIADLVEKVPALSNPVTRFLASDPTDNEAAGRLRNALAGVGFGELQNGVLAGLGMLRGAMAAQRAELPETPVAPGEQGAPTPEAFKFLGNPDAAPGEPLASFKTPELSPEAYKAAAAEEATRGLTPEQVQAMGTPATPEELAGPRVPGATEAQAKEPQVYINFARIDTPDDVKRTMSQLADAQGDNIAAARRGIQTFEQTKLGAAFQDAWKTLMSRRQGEPLNAEQQLAGRQLLAQSAMTADKLTQMAIDDPSTENLFAWRKQMQTHAMIQAEVSGSQAEIARSLSAMRIPVSGQEAVDRMGALTQQLDQMGGMKSNLDFLKATKVLMDSGRLEDLGNVAERTMYAKTRDALITGWTNGLLTNPLTHVKVNLSNIGTIALRLGETRFAEGMDQMTDFDGVPAGEAAQTTAGLISGIKDAFRYVTSLAGLNEAPESSPVQDAQKAFQTGHYSVGAQEPDWMQPGQEAGNALAIADSGWVGKATDLMSSLVTSPGRALAGEHEFYRSIGMRMELNRFAYRQAMDELNSGTIGPGEVAGRVAELVEKPPPGLSTAAVDGMQYQTFTDAPGKLAEILGNLREAYPLARVILPFYKIPSRIMSFTFERSPLAPLMAGWRADIAAGGARQSMALAKTGLGSMVMLAASDAVLNGQITGEGPKDKGQRQALMDTGWLPYSVKAPSGRWVQYNRLETVGSSMALAADITETIRDYHTAVNTDDPNVEKLTAAGIAALANAVTSKTYFEGVARFFDTISDPRSNAQSMMKTFAASVVPAGVGALAGAMDPYTRATYSMMDALRSRTPGLSKDLPPLMNMWGEPVRHDSGLGKAYDAFVPFASRRPGDEPIDKEILSQGMHLTAPAAKTSMGDGAVVDLSRDPHAYARYQQLAGNELKLPGPNGDLGLKDRLNDIVTGADALSPLYNMRSDGPDGGKYLMLRGIMEEYRRAARDQVLGENEPLKEKVAAAEERHRELRSLNVSTP
jgi:hypothetical protein